MLLLLLLLWMLWLLLMGRLALLMLAVAAGEKAMGAGFLVWVGGPPPMLGGGIMTLSLPGAMPALRILGPLFERTGVVDPTPEPWRLSEEPSREPWSFCVRKLPPLRGLLKMLGASAGAAATFAVGGIAVALGSA